MSFATVTTKGQITIPKDIRKLLKLHTGDKIEISVTEDGSAIIQPVSKKVDDIFCKLHKSGRKAVSVEDMNNAIQKRRFYLFKLAK